MNKKIQTYDDLLDEKKRLEELIVIQKQQISANWIEVKEEFKPVNDTISFLGKLTSRDKRNPLLNMGIDIVGDVLVRRIILAKADWVTRLAVPFLVKNYSSNIIVDKGKSFIYKIKHWLKGNKNSDENSDEGKLPSQY